MKTELDIKNTRIIQIMVDNRYRVFRHVVLLLASLFVICFTNWQADYHGAYKYYRITCVYGILLVMCYMNMAVLVPLFFFKDRYLLYMGLLALQVFLCLHLLNALLHNYLSIGPFSHGLEPDTDKRGFYEGFVTVVPIILVTTMIKLFQRWTRDNGRIAELTTIALRTELNDLKNQINPHFLFNMLNGIKSLIRTDPEKATLIIVKLSEFLRYQIYENNDEKTSLRAELTFLSNFLSLEMTRRDNLSVEINIPTEPQVLNGLYVPPNLFTTFVENAVKHSVDISEGKACIKIELSLHENQLYFSCTNSKDPSFTPSNHKHSGLGLANIKRRLTLLYDDTYTLDVLNTTDQFSITLKLPL